MCPFLSQNTYIPAIDLSLETCIQRKAIAFACGKNMNEFLTEKYTCQ